MATNSSSCKAWCVGLVSAIAVVVAEASRVGLLVVAAIPIVLFGLLDAYYLGLERRFRGSYERFVRKLHSGTAQVDDAFVIAPKQPLSATAQEALGALTSFSIWPFYIGLALLLWILGRRLSAVP
jgi:hypothetical protein